MGEVASVSSPKLKVDQSNTVSDGLGLDNGFYGQTYVPKAKNVARIELLLQINNLQEDVPVVLGLFTELADGTPLNPTADFVFTTYSSK